MAKKIMKQAERREIIYSKKHWDLLRELRTVATRTMEIFDQIPCHSIVHGSIARGDISEESDIDIFLPDPPSSFIIEMVLERQQDPIYRRFIVQATPFYAVKGYIEIGKRICVSFPLVKFRSVEIDFYKFGGEVSLGMLRKNIRVSGVDKRLMLIEPRTLGHIESAIVGQEEKVAQFLGVSPDTVLGRVHALLRRDKIGRTGVFLERELEGEETFEMVVQKLADHNPALRRRLRSREK